ncbi:heterokaryon incompatibility protein-domain-containing protein, partial [Echria macrotheca]
MGRKSSARWRKGKGTQQGTQPPSNPEFCARCRQIDFWAIFHPPKPILPKDSRPVLALDQLDRDSDCPVCRLFYLARVRAGSEPEDRGYHLRVLGTSGGLLGATPGALRHEEFLPVALGVFPGCDLGRNPDWSQQLRARESGLLVAQVKQSEPLCTPRRLLEGSRVNPRRADFGRLRGWLQDCDDLHSGTCRPVARISSLSVPLRCIDCLTRAIVEIQPDDVYATLSYVWGAPATTRCDGGRLPDGVSQVIEDAITAVRKLRIRYLWVDKYCVDQENHDIRDAQVKEMDIVYASAYVTIVAGAGRDANFGLPGVGSIQRETWPSVSLKSASKGGRLEIHPTGPSLPDAMTNTAWVTRGWTYQEAVLSQRCLVFTTSQVYFTCPVADHCEAIVEYSSSSAFPKQTPVIQRGESDMTLHASRFFKTETRLQGEKHVSPWQRYTEHVIEYSGRVLTYEQDILNAFRGVLARSPFYTYFGLPLAVSSPANSLDATYVRRTSPNTWLTRSLSWVEADGAESVPGRRPGFPSWSWVSHRGRVEFFCPLSWDYAERDAYFWVEDTNGRLLDLRTLIISNTAGGGGTRMIPELSPYLVVDASVLRFRFQPRHSDRPDLPPRLCVCTCHFDSVHPGGVTDGQCVWSHRVAFEGAVHGSAMYSRAVTETWDCVRLFVEDIYISFYLIIDWVGDVAYRVGYLSLLREEMLSHDMDVLSKVESTRRRIRLG